MNRACHTLLFAACLAGSVLAPVAARAQHMMPAAAPAPAAAPEQAVVLVAMTGDATVDPHLRATAEALKQRVHERGYRDVDPAKLGQALGSPGGVATLRNRLGAACLVRVDVQAHDASGVSLLLVVQTQAGEQSVSVQSSLVETSAKVVAAADPLIPPAKVVAQPAPAAVPVAPPVAPPQVDPPQVIGEDRVVLVDGTVLQGTLLGFAGGQSVMLRTRDGAAHTIPWHQVKQILPNAGGGESWNFATDKPKTKAVDWSQRGGSLLTMDLQAQILGMMARSDHPYVVQYPDGQTMTFTGDSPAGGGGGGLGFHMGFMQMAIPDPAESDTIWAFRVGTGIDLGYVAFAHRTRNVTNVGQLQDGEMKVPLTQEGGETKWSSATVVMLPLFLGGQVGSGHFVSEGVWRGVMFGLDWRPTYTYANPSELDSISSFNYLGMQAHVDMGSISADQSLEPSFQISVTFLPQIDRNATFASLGFGAVWY
jgi:hypothetical protein